MATTAARREVLSDALDAFLKAGDFETTLNPRGYIKAENRLIDAAVDCGMDRDHAFPSEWASVIVAYGTPISGLWAGSGIARNYSLEVG